MQEGVADGARPGDADLPREADRRAGGADAPGRHDHRHLLSESAVLRAQANRAARAATAELQADAARTFVNDAAVRVEASAKQALAAILDGDTLRTTIAGLRRLFRQMPINTAVLRRRLADEVVAKGGYFF